jgi:hypothetical protein
VNGKVNVTEIEICVASETWKGFSMVFAREISM